MPTNISNYVTYKVNQEMKNQEGSNELSRCVNYFNNFRTSFSNGTKEDFCKGTGTVLGYTFQVALDNEIFFDEFMIEEMLSLNIITQNNDTYMVNPIMQSQQIIDNELSRCMSIFTELDLELDVESTFESFCKGTGISNGMNIQEYFDNWIDESKQYDEDFLEVGGQEFIDAGVIIPEIENLPYFEFTISGKNTYTKEDIYYEVVLTYGDKHETRNTRIKDELLKFTLLEVVGEDEKPLVYNKNYSSLSNRKIWVETINKNTTTEVKKTYRLYMWIDENTVLGNVNQDYTLEEWNDVFASIKVNVTGDFSKKVVDTHESCFYTENIDNNGVTEIAIIDYDTKCGTDVVIPKTINGYDVTAINDGAFFDKGLKSVVIPNSVTIIDSSAFAYNKLTNVVIPNSVTIIENSAFVYNQLTSIEIPDRVTFIGYDAFRGNQLTSVVIPDSVTGIGSFAFASNYLTEVTLGENIEDIGYGAFQIIYKYGLSSNNIKTIINKSGNSFNWSDIFEKSSLDGNDEFIAGEFKYYDELYGDSVVLITEE